MMMSPAPITNDEEVRIVMVGKTGVGKSGTGNTILGYEAFVSKMSAGSLTVFCQKMHRVNPKPKVSVVDTPGLCDTRVAEAVVVNEIRKCMCFAAPGPHVFLIVIRLGRFTPEEQQTVETIQTVFGEMSSKYTIILFTGGDMLNGPVEDFLDGSPKLKELIRKCDGRYHVFANNTEDRSQVTELEAKIKAMVKTNGGSHYTNETFQIAEREIQHEQTRILTSNAAERITEMQALTKIFTGPALIQAQAQKNKEHEQDARKKAEKNNSFLSRMLGAIRGACVIL